MRSREQGAALILVLGAVALLTIVAVELASRANADVMSAARTIRNAAFRRLFDSAGEVAKATLFDRKPQDFDYAGDEWNEPQSFTLGEGETATFRMEDESGKINLALAWKDKAPVRAQVVRLFEYLRRRKPQGAKELKEVEEKVLKRLDFPEPPMTLDDLRETGLSLEAIFAEGGLSKYFTCFSDGPVNVNTAPPAVLYALAEEFDEALVDHVVAYRGTPKSPKAFESVKDLALIDGVVVRAFENGQFRVVKDLLEKHGRLLTVASTAFGVRIDASVGKRDRQAWYFLKPDGSRITFEELWP